MVDVDQEGIIGNLSYKKKLFSTAMKRTTEWIFSQEFPRDVTVRAGGKSFSLHKFPLLSKCGYIRKLVNESTDADISKIEIPDIPGGAEAFGLAAKFCYGIWFEINTTNIAMLRCAAEYLEMTEDYAIGNLVGMTEAYLREVALNSLAGAVSVLHSSESLLPMAEKVKLVSRCVDRIAYIASSKDGQFCTEDMTDLRIDFFQRVLVAMMARGVKQCALGQILMLYAQKALQGLEMFGHGTKKTEAREEHEKRVVLETIVSLLPKERNSLSVSFLSMLLRAAIFLETTVACRLDLEKRLGFHLGQAVVDDLLIPSYCLSGTTLFDVETVQRVMMNFLEYQLEGSRLCFHPNEEYVAPSPSDMERVGRLMENYLAEIASDRNLSVSKFINLAELIPEQSRTTEDGMYRAIDIYLKAHPALTDMERKKVCGVMDCQKLSPEACAHAAQNDRLPAQTVVQVLYYEKQRLGEVMNSSIISDKCPTLPSKGTSEFCPDIHPVSDELSSLRRENHGLKMELVRMRMRLKEMDECSDKSSLRMAHSFADRSPLPRPSFISSMSKMFGKLSPITWKNGRNKASRNRRNSIS
ncbi:hypothetical protein DM860_008434 [Cuscuta australis]|uniref:NPH3 domain-containing protein n=1 Tax=Cuscuta australis TaxID=267555 RepID=A0A328D5B8_9ASTE|nr:hypothetical protein DM860_008434 [Cuscuta australis]